MKILADFDQDGDFNTSNVSVEQGSCSKKIAPSLYFNTSNVSVEPGFDFSLVTWNGDFNTSNVSVEHIDTASGMQQWLDFNTSNVSVERRNKCVFHPIYPISIHPMFRLNLSPVSP